MLRAAASFTCNVLCASVSATVGVRVRVAQEAHVRERLGDGTRALAVEHRAHQDEVRASRRFS